MQNTFANKCLFANLKRAVYLCSYTAQKDATLIAIGLALCPFGRQHVSNNFLPYVKPLYRHQYNGIFIGEHDTSLLLLLHSVLSGGYYAYYLVQQVKNTSFYNQ